MTIVSHGCFLILIFVYSFSGYGVETRPNGTIRHDGLWENDKVSFSANFVFQYAFLFVVRLYIS